MKKSQGAQEIVTHKSMRSKIWLGFSAMEQLVVDVRVEPIYPTKSVRELVKEGFLESEAQELQTTTIAFPRVKQEFWPIARLDKVPGQHFHITQVPFDVEVEEST